MRAVDKTLTSVPHKLLHVFQRSLYGKTRRCSFIAVEKKYSVRGTSSNNPADPISSATGRPISGQVLEHSSKPDRWALEHVQSLPVAPSFDSFSSKFNRTTNANSSARGRTSPHVCAHLRSVRWRKNQIFVKRWFIIHLTLSRALKKNKNLRIHLPPPSLRWRHRCAHLPRWTISHLDTNPQNLRNLLPVRWKCSPKNSIKINWKLLEHFNEIHLNLINLSFKFFLKN
jgi:hypothetical protein